LTFQIVETMAYTNPVADFVSSLDSFYESVSIDDLQMVVGPMERDNLIGIFIQYVIKIKNTNCKICRLNPLLLLK